MFRYLLSYPKSGRTWMRFAITNLLQDIYKIPGEFNLENMFSLIPNDDGSKSQPQKEIEFYKFYQLDIPRIAMTHNQYEERYIKEKSVFLLRNPADVLVSRYHHLRHHQERIDSSINEFVMSDEGATHLLSYLESWADHLNSDTIMTMTYESLRSQPEDEFIKIVNQLGIEGVGQNRAKEALSKSSVSHMRRLEKEYGIGEPNDYDKKNPNALRVRKAKVGGFKKEMPEESFNYLIEKIEESPKVKDLLLKEGIYPAIEKGD